MIVVCVRRDIDIKTQARKVTTTTIKKSSTKNFLKKLTIRPNQSLLAFDSFASIKKQREKQGEREREIQ
jgi:hypothetical protein